MAGWKSDDLDNVEENFQKLNIGGANPRHDQQNGLPKENCNREAKEPRRYQHSDSGNSEDDRFFDPNRWKWTFRGDDGWVTSPAPSSVNAKEPSDSRTTTSAREMHSTEGGQERSNLDAGNDTEENSEQNIDLGGIALQLLPGDHEDNSESASEQIVDLGGITLQMLPGDDEDAESNDDGAADDFDDGALDDGGGLGDDGGVDDDGGIDDDGGFDDDFDDGGLDDDFDDGGYDDFDDNDDYDNFDDDYGDDYD